MTSDTTSNQSANNVPEKSDLGEKKEVEAGKRDAPPLSAVDRFQVRLFKVLWICAGAMTLLTALYFFLPETTQVQIRRHLFRFLRQDATAEIKAQRAEGRAKDFLDQLGYKNLPNHLRLVVLKKEHRLDIYDDKRLLHSCPVALGRSPVGNKEREGDCHTPEGTYYVCAKNDQSDFYLFLGLSYPNKEDAARGLKDKLIPQEQYDKICEAITEQRRPPWTTPLGGLIGIHGHGAKGDWTAGCVAVENEEMELLFGLCDEKTPVEIRP